MSDKLSVPSQSQQVTLLVADDADVIRKTLRNLLKGEAGRDSLRRAHAR